MNTTPTRLDAGDLQGLYQYAMVLCQHPENAQDLLQSGVETFLLDMRSGKRIEKPLYYIRRVIRNRFIDQYRHQQRWNIDSFEEQASYDISPIDIEQMHIDQQALQQVWGTLAPEDRDILYHWAILGYSTDEACRLLGMPRGTFLSRIHRLRKQCNDLMHTDSANNQGAQK